MKKDQMQFHKVLNDAWERTLSDYQSGNVIIKNERDLENALATSCEFLMQERTIPIRMGRQETFRDKRVDIRIGYPNDPILVELKLYHDKADWKESKSMKNTVESDLRFAKGYEDTYVGIIDVIPSTQRAYLDYSLEWNELEIPEEIFNLHYVGINPSFSPPRERIQKSVLVNGIMI